MTSTPKRISLVMPYYNEARFILATLDSLAAQDTRDFKLIVVNNRSDDASPAMVDEFLAASGFDYLHVEEPEPGIVSAMQKGISLADGELLGILNADVIYPPHYLSRCFELFDANPKASSVMAVDIYDPPETRAAQIRLRRVKFASVMLPRKCHAGSYAQVWRLGLLREGGGFDRAIWPYVLEDHEIMVRMMHKGRSIYATDHYCHPSTRRTNSRAVSWNRWEKAAYGLLPSRTMPWFFYRYLASQFARRKMVSAALRNRNWE